MNEIHSTIEYKGYNINIHFDPDPRSPREEYDNLGTLYTAHRHYRPEQDFDKHFNMEDVCPKRLGEFSDQFMKEYIALPVYMYDHGGQTVSTGPFGCHWDSGFFGIIAVSLDQVRKEYGWKNITAKRRKEIETYLGNEVKTYDDYLTGATYGYTLIDPEGEEIESCWGYYGDDNIPEIEKECRAMIDYRIGKQRIDKIKAKIEAIRKYGLQLLIPFTEFPEYVSEPIIE